MSCCDVPGLMPLAEAIDRMQITLSNVCGSMTLPLSDALGYTLSQDIISQQNVPPFNNSAMDGYALDRHDLAACSSENPITLKQVGKSFAGVPFTGDIQPGQCIRIMTGAVLPESLNCIVMQEQTQAEGDNIIFVETPKLHSNVRFAGEDLSVGQTVLKQGHKLTPRDIPLLASLGIDTLPVYRQLKVAVLSSGDELRPLGSKLEQGEIYDSNRYSIIGLLSRLNVEVIDFGIIKDDYREIKETLIKADQQADVVITSGGVSVGEADFIKEVLNEIGEIGFWKLAIKPGKPFAFGKLQNSVFFGLPGNPVSAIVTLYQLAVPAMAKMSGELVKPALRLNAVCNDALRKAPGRTDFQRGNYSVNEQGQLVVTTTGNQGSGVFSSMSQSNCFIVLEQDRGNIAKGETVEIEPYSHLMD
ncbi:molybdopterin molybdotransferase MoeA [Psychromonas sp. 14N.309.X.WAT.B.A12]|uniref:molybdopterin molybdotransferase MoeA n=1 Tax=unclassified Psychromonas TaxID=2614957 RepID=UPI0025B15738|nr:molybdopterin molybdotransferase MoeA [Psychromonas sp. 14N.309.X.WAT.B.A12]MDN2662027.1 molybdopterin molybdotransferase MoeA [Psychromonas sp. 14N.309.X.WAT.B.A12]